MLNNNINLPPRVYVLDMDRSTREYYLKEDIPYFITPAKLYGDMGKQAAYFWNAYRQSNKSLGVLFTGSPGSGKTEIANVISNIAIAEGMAVVLVVGIKADIPLINFLGNLVNVVIMFDEFGKVFSMDLQDKMLSMLSSANGFKKLFLITENNSLSVSEFIRNRPGRVRYHIDYNRLNRKVIDEYCADFNMIPSYYNDLIELYNKSITFSFDHMSAIVSEHLIDKTVPLSEILEILNLEILTKTVKMYISDIIDMVTLEPVEFKASDIDKNYFDKKGRFWVSMSSKDISGFDISQEHITQVYDDYIICEYQNKYRVTIRYRD